MHMTADANFRARNLKTKLHERLHLTFIKKKIFKRQSIKIFFFWNGDNYMLQLGI